MPAENRVTIIIDAKNAERTKRALREIGIQSKTMGTHMKTTSKMAGLLTYAMRALGAIGIGLIFRNMTRDAIEFEDAFVGVKKTVDATKEEFAQLSEGIIELSKRIPMAAKELAGIQAVAGQLGVRGVANLTKFTETIAHLTTTTDIAGKAGALQLARFLSILGESDAVIDRAAAALVGLGNNFRTNEAELLDISLNLASFGSQIGLTAAQVLAFGTAIKSAGGIAQAASTAFQKVALVMKDAVITGNEKLKEFAEVAGKSIEEFKKLFEEDAAEALTVFLEGLQKIDVAGGSITQALGKIGLADVRLIREFGKVIKQTDVLRAALKRSAIDWDENKAHLEEAAKKYSSTASQIQIFKNNVAALNIALGEIFLPIIKKILPVMTGFITGIEHIALGFDAVKIGALNVAIALDTLINSLPGKRGALDEEIAKLKEMRDTAVASAADHIDSLSGVIDKIEEVGAAQIKTNEEIRVANEEKLAAELEAETAANEKKKALAEEFSGANLAIKQQAAEKEQVLLDIWVKSNTSAWAVLGQTKDAFSKGVSKMFMDMIKGTADVGEAFKELGLKIVQVLLDWVVQTAINAALSKAFKAAEVAASSAAGAAVAAAWAPAAANVSLATFGANAAPAAAGIATTHALTTPMSVPKMEKGGIIEGSPEGRLVLAGERNKREAIVPLEGIGTPRFGNNITINVEAIINQEIDIELLAERLGFFVERETGRARTIG